mgnify:CR=1 FL=1
MKRTILGGLMLGVACLVPTIAGAPARAALIITEVMASSSHPGGAANGDWWELLNNGPTAVNLENWFWNDDNKLGGTKRIFGNVTINPGEIILVVDEPTNNIAGFRDAWGLGSSLQILSSQQVTNAFAGLGANGDEVNLYDPSNTLVASVAFGVSTTGQTFAWDASGTSLGKSVDGQYGAYVALGNGDGGAGTDVGSPGYVYVPEPSTLALVFVLLAAGWAARRAGLG